MLAPKEQIKQLQERFGDNIPLSDALILALEVENWDYYPYEYEDQHGIQRKLNKQQYILSMVKTINNG